jgi:hypothetical protein
MWMVKAVRVTGLVVDGGTPGAAPTEDVFDEVEVPVEQVNPSTFDDEPASAVDPGSLPAEIRYGIWWVGSSSS